MLPSIDWVKAATSTIATVGVPAVIALGFSYWVSTEVVKNQQIIMAEGRERAMALARVERELNDHRAQTQATIMEALFYLQQNCVILARLASTNAESCVPTMKFYPEPSPDPSPPVRARPTPNRMFDR